jgi:hypothetical protein
MSLANLMLGHGHSARNCKSRSRGWEPVVFVAETTWVLNFELRSISKKRVPGHRCSAQIFRPAALVDPLERATIHDCQILNENLLPALEELDPAAGDAGIFAREIIGEGIAVPVRQLVVRIARR